MKLVVGVCLLCLAPAGCALDDPAVIAGVSTADAGGAQLDAGFDTTPETANAATGEGGASDSGDGVTGPDGGGGLEAAGSGSIDGGEGGIDGGAIDPSLPKEPVIPAVCAALLAAKASSNGLLSDENNPDTGRIQMAINSCPEGQSVKLQSNGSYNAFLSGPLTILRGVTLWVDTGATLFASRNPRDFDVSLGSCGTYAMNSSSGCKPMIGIAVPNAGVMGDGIIDGRGGEPMIGSATTWWDVAQAASGASSKHSNPTLIDVNGAQNVTLYKITLQNSPMFHAVVGSKGFMVWGVTIQTPSMSTNSAGKALTANYARNTDGIDPSGASDGYVVYSKISTGDDQISIKGGSRGPVQNLVIAHNHFGTGHGMAIGSETNSGVSNIKVYDLSMDGTIADGGMSATQRNGIRITSGPSRGGLVNNVTYTDVCTRDLDNPIMIDARASSGSGSLIPQFNGVTIANFHALRSTVVPTVTLNGYDASHLLVLSLDNVTVDGIATANVTASFAKMALGPGAVNFTPSGSNVTATNGVSGASLSNSCSGKWVTF